MLRTCLDTGDTSTKEFPTATSTTPATAHPPSTSYSAEKVIFDNGDIFGNKTDSAVFNRTAFSDQFPVPEEIPGLPRHRPATTAGEYSPTYDRRSLRG